MDERYLALHHHWHIDDSMGKELDHTGYFFHDQWFGDMDNLFQVR